MASSLFGSNGVSSKIDSLRQMVGGNPDAFMQRMMRANPQFAEFVQKNRSKTPDQIAAEYGIDISQLRKFM